MPQNSGESNDTIRPDFFGDEGGVGGKFLMRGFLLERKRKCKQNVSKKSKCIKMSKICPKCVNQLIMLQLCLNIRLWKISQKYRNCTGN